MVFAELYHLSSIFVISSPSALTATLIIISSRILLSVLENIEFGNSCTLNNFSWIELI